VENVLCIGYRVPSPGRRPASPRKSVHPAAPRLTPNRNGAENFSSPVGRCTSRNECGANICALMPAPAWGRVRGHMWECQIPGTKPGRKSPRPQKSLNNAPPKRLCLQGFQQRRKGKPHADGWAFPGDGDLLLILDADPLAVPRICVHCSRRLSESAPNSSDGHLV